MSFILSLFLVTINLQQGGPYAEFYLNDKKLSDNPVINLGATPQVKFFTHDSLEIRGQIRNGSISLVRSSVTVKTKQIKDSNFQLEFRAEIRPGDQLIIDLKKVWDIDRQKEIYLRKTVFIFTFE